MGEGVTVEVFMYKETAPCGSCQATVPFLALLNAGCRHVCQIATDGAGHQSPVVTANFTLDTVGDCLEPLPPLPLLRAMVVGQVAAAGLMGSKTRVDLV
jgi:hypothetical protein